MYKYIFNQSTKENQCKILLDKRYFHQWIHNNKKKASIVKVVIIINK